MEEDESNVEDVADDALTADEEANSFLVDLNKPYWLENNMTN